MRFVSIKDQVATVAKRWEKQYITCSVAFTDPKRKKIWFELLSLDEKATPEDVEKIIGNHTWIGDRCDECHNIVNEYFEIGWEPVCGDAIASLCKKCVRKLADMVSDP